MINTGLVSVTFRKLTPRAIVDLVRSAVLDAIEWGGDVHVPHGDIKTAGAVRRMTEDAGLSVAAYGSYYRVGYGEPVAFETVLETAVALGAPLIRVWAGKQGSDATDEATWERVIEDSIHCADVAAGAGLGIAFEYHGNTLTDTDEAAVRLLEAVSRSSVTCYWQPRGHASVTQNLTGLTRILPRLSHIHVQSWRTQSGGGIEGSARAPLSAMTAPWSQWLTAASTAPGEHAAMIEFVADDSAEQFLADAQILKNLTRGR